MTIHRSLFSGRTDEWPTPRQFFEALNREFKFTLDPCASAVNATCRRFFTRREDGLRQAWGTHRVFCNPPYGRTMGDWARKCHEASLHGALVVQEGANWGSPRSVLRRYSGSMREPLLVMSGEIGSRTPAGHLVSIAFSERLVHNRCMIRKSFRQFEEREGPNRVTDLSGG